MILSRTCTLCGPIKFSSLAKKLGIVLFYLHTSHVLTYQPNTLPSTEITGTKGAQRQWIIQFTTYSWTTRKLLELIFLWFASNISVSRTNNTATRIYVKETCSYDCWSRFLSMKICFKRYWQRAISWFLSSSRQTTWPTLLFVLNQEIIVFTWSKSHSTLVKFLRNVFDLSEDSFSIWQMTCTCYSNDVPR